MSESGPWGVAGGEPQWYGRQGCPIADSRCDVYGAIPQLLPDDTDNVNTAVIRRARNLRGSQVLRLASGAGIIFLFLLVETACSDSGTTGGSAASRAVKARANTVRGSVTLSWTPPTQNTDGSKLGDLAGYRIYYGTSKEYFQRVIEINDPGATGYTINDLPTFTYYFAVSAYNTAGAESARSNVRSKIVR